VAESLVFSVLWRIRVAAWSNRILAPDPAVETLNNQLAPTLVSEHLFGGYRSIALAVVKAGSPLRIKALIRPTAIWSLEDDPVSAFAHGEIPPS
jgi:hypothetical protein